MGVFFILVFRLSSSEFYFFVCLKKIENFYFKKYAYFVYFF